ncbi:MAG TPA: SMP-30/gluconolactonase/LRE family protein [Acidobacteriota bacterium]|nr:SMP-30/gluconolactonase/LRE family protein [Acidobacteriota bacterium]
MQKLVSAFFMTATIIVAGCTPAEREAARLPCWSFSQEMIFPADRALMRPEDGVALPDGRLLVADQLYGLRLLEADGSSRPFGQFAEAGYLHSPPEIVGGANGVTLEPGGAHVLVSDVFRGGIYQVDVATESTDRIYQHSYGVNMARRDRRGGVWFTQSTRNSRERGEEELFRAVAVAVSDGGIFYLPPSLHEGDDAARQLVDGLYFANGIALDEAAGYLYVAETTGSRVLRFKMDAATGQVGDRVTALEVNHPDNLELDGRDRLWIASPLRGEIVVFDLATQTVESVIRISTPESERLIETIEARVRIGEPWLDLMAPELWEPAPGLITGMILQPDGRSIYLTGLGNALIELKR